jgi:MoxR-like ATPase
MQEKAVTVAGQRHPLEEPFFVLATQNPIEMEGTYPLPEAQVDRFLFKIEVPPSKLDELMQVIDRTTGKDVPTVRQVLNAADIMSMRELAKEVEIASHVKEYAARVVLATNPAGGSPVAKKFLRYGSSPRGAQAMVRAGKIMALRKGRYNVSFGDLREAAFPSLRHRMILNFEAEAEGIKADAILEKILAEIPEVAAAR